MWRAWTVFAVFILVLGAIWIRLFYWQVIAAESLRMQAASQYYREFTIPSSRGSIYSSDGDALAMNEPSYLVYANPSRISDPLQFSSDVAAVLQNDSKELLPLVSDPQRLWVPLAHKISVEKAELLENLRLDGLGLEKEPKRFYPESSMAAHLLGFVGQDIVGKDTGYFGLEGYYNRQLSGKDGFLRQEIDAKGTPILIGQAKRIEPTDGRDIVLWMERSVQQIVERRLLEGIRKYGALEGNVVVMDPATGGILAMASYPSYDPLSYTQYDKELYKNPVVAATYEPGSTFKVLIVSAALNEKRITPTTTIEESGPLQVGQYTIRTWNNEYNGTQTITQVLENSSNVGMVFVAKMLGLDTMLRYIKDFGFGSLTGIDLQDEVPADMRPDEDWKEIDTYTASFGQGIAVTPIQMVTAVSALANGGWLMEPHVVKQSQEKNGKSTPYKPKKVRQVVSQATARIITEMMVSAVEKGDAKWAKPKGYRIAGKTGTAQIPMAGHYDEEKTIASFVGFAPADNPKFTMLVTLREPTSSPWGSETAAPLFFTIANDLFTHWGIHPQ